MLLVHESDSRDLVVEDCGAIPDMEDKEGEVSIFHAYICISIDEYYRLLFTKLPYMVIYPS